MVFEGLTMDRILEAVEESMIGLGNPGFCIACGADADGCEPDARNYKCHACGAMKVFGAEECLFMFGA